MKSDNGANGPTAASPGKLSDPLENSDCINTHASSFRPSADRLRAIAIASEAILLGSDNGKFLSED